MRLLRVMVRVRVRVRVRVMVMVTLSTLKLLSSHENQTLSARSESPLA